MTDDERFRLLFGPYSTPRFRYGDVVFCDVRGEVTICGLTAAPIPWPLGKRGRATTIAVYGRLSDAVRRESAQAVAHWWGVTAQTVSIWRKALGVGPSNEGTFRLHSEYSAEPWAGVGREKARAKAGDPQRRAKIAAARRGKPRPRHVCEAIGDAHRGTHHTEEHRRKISEALRRRGHRPPKAGRPWTAAEDQLARTLPAAEVARRTGRTLGAVWTRRRLLGVPDGRRR